MVLVALCYAWVATGSQVVMAAYLDGILPMRRINDRGKG